jgi:hypothetical protein
MKSFIKFNESSQPPAGVHREVWHAHLRHMDASKKHYESGLGMHKAAATRTFSTLKKKLQKHEPDESKHLKIMQDMMHHSEKD